MNAERKTLADLFARLHGMGVEAAGRTPCHECENDDLMDQPPPMPCAYCGGTNLARIEERQVLQVLGEMMGRKLEVTESDVLDAAKKAGVF